MTRKQNNGEQGVVLRIERCSIYDGHGIRTVVFLKGCPLSCWWCSTPESQSFEIERTEDNIYGQLMTVEEVMKEIRKDSAFYFHSGGGMTLSGGEILSQPDFAREILKASRNECISTAIETTFFSPWETVHSILPYVNTAFVDFKLIDEEEHKKYCGGGNQLIHQNLLRTNETKAPFGLIIRTPIIPGINDSEKELAGIGEFCSQLKHLIHVQLLPYHRLGTDTYRKLGRSYKLNHINSPSGEHMLKCSEIVNRYVTCKL